MFSSKCRGIASNTDLFFYTFCLFHHSKSSVGMQALKGNWVGQTFAVAKSNESGGKKTRIRRSKEERKAMVESFIKKFQRQNDGNFPSLSLTHREVGGSFYTVREIVREIIQENRVLGPAKLTLEEQNTNQLVEQSPLGSISTGFHDSLPLSSNENLFVVDNDVGFREELISVSDGLSTGPGHQGLGSGQIINGSAGKRDCGKKTYVEVEVIEPSEAEKGMVATTTEVIHTAEYAAETMANVAHMTDNVAATTEVQPTHVTEDAATAKAKAIHVTEDAATAKAKAFHVTEDVATAMGTVTSLTADVIVETFPLRPVNKTTDFLDGDPGELSGTLEENRIGKLDLESSNGKINSIGLAETPEKSGLVDKKGSEKTAASLLGVNFVLVEKEAAEHTADSPFGNSNCSTSIEVLRHETLANTDDEIEVTPNDVLTPQTVEHSKSSAGTEADNVPYNIHTKMANVTSSCGSQVSTIQPPIMTGNKDDIQDNVSPAKEINTTLKRIKPESWKGASDNFAEPETNPLLKIFKSFIAAFVKFWSE